MKFIRKALWPTAIVAAFLMLFGALGNAVNADEVDGGVKTEKGGVVYVEVELAAGALAADSAAAAKAVTAAQTLIADASTPVNKIPADIVAAATALRAAAVKVEAVIIAIDKANGDMAIFDVQDDNLVVAIPDEAGAVAALTDGLATASTNVGAASAAMVTGVTALTPTADKTHDYTVEIDDGSGSASIVATLRSGDGGSDGGDANVASNRATDSRTVTPVKVNDNADRGELKDYGVNAEVGESYVLVVVECTEFGSYTISFTHGTDGDVVDADLECATDVHSAVLTASTSTIFTTTSKLTSDITVTLEDEDGDAATPGDRVRFKTDNCEFKYETTSKATRNVESETDDDGDTTAVVTLDCSESSAKVGTATVSASVDRPGSDVYAEPIVITLVGPAAALTLTVAAPMDNMVCGSVRQIDITEVVDKNGEIVANGTDVIVSTNFGGVLTGATTGRFAPSSTVTSTVDGAATVYLITSDTHVGDYAVVALGGVSAVGKLTVVCMAEMMDMDDAADAAAAITPPTTGNAGLAETSGSSWMLLAIAGVLASVMVAAGKGMPSFFRR